ncbi:MAG: hypothetical protein U9N86_19180 [Bacteroidota bacterium]|nr:hypothetical protein [Bacteroidota bacterium]
MRNNPQLRLLEYTSRRKLGKEYADSHLELETNTQVRAEMEKMGGVVYKKCRIFQKRLTRGLGDSGTR